MGLLLGADQTFLSRGDDLTVGPIDIPGGLPFGNSTQTQLYVSLNLR